MLEIESLGHRWPVQTSKWWWWQLRSFWKIYQELDLEPKQSCWHEQNEIFTGWTVHFRRNRSPTLEFSVINTNTYNNTTTNKDIRVFRHLFETQSRQRPFFFFLRGDALEMPFQSILEVHWKDAQNASRASIGVLSEMMVALYVGRDTLTQADGKSLFQKRSWWMDMLSCTRPSLRPSQATTGPVDHAYNWARERPNVNVFVPNDLFVESDSKNYKSCYTGIN